MDTIPSSTRYKHFWENKQEAITYDRLIMDHTSGVHLGNFDVDEGIFTARTPGDIL